MLNVGVVHRSTDLHTTTRRQSTDYCPFRAVLAIGRNLAAGGTGSRDLSTHAFLRRWNPSPPERAVQALTSEMKGSVLGLIAGMRVGASERWQVPVWQVSLPAVTMQATDGAVCKVPVRHSLLPKERRNQLSHAFVAA